MNLDELIEQKAELEAKLMKLYLTEVKKFEEETNARVTGIEVKVMLHFDYLGNMLTSLSDVKCEVRYKGVRIGE